MKEVLITSSVLIVAIVIIRAVLKKRVSSRLIYALWLVAALRLMLPFSLAPSPVSVMNAAPEAISALVVDAEDSGVTPGEAELASDPAPVVNPGPVSEPATDVQSPAQDSTQNVPEPVRAGFDIDWAALLPVIWLAGLVLCAAYMLIVNGAMYFRLRGNRRRVEVDSPLKVYLVENIPSPCLFGFVRPAIYLTSSALESDERTHMVVLHEETHYRHGDHIWSLLRCVLLCAYWFDPLVWLAAYLSRRDAELACDESCVKALGHDRRIDYGQALVDQIGRARRAGGILRTATTMSGSKRAIKERVTRIVKAPRTRTAAVVLIIALVGVVSACTFTGAQTSPEASLNPGEPLTNATAYARLADGSMYDVTQTHSYEYDADTGETVLRYTDGQTVDFSLPANLASPYAFMSDTVAAVSFVDSEGSLRVMLSRNRGEDWTEQTVASGLESDTVTFIGFSNVSDGWLLWEGYYNTGNIVLETDDFGNVTTYEDVEYRTKSYITNDGGESWTETRMNRARGSVTGMAVVDGTAYIGVTGDGSMSYSYYTGSGEGYDSLFPKLLGSNEGMAPDTEFTSTLSPVISDGGVVLPYLMPDGGVVNREADIVHGGLAVPEPLTDVDGILELPCGVNIAPATEELLSQLRGPVTFGDIEEGQTALVAFTDDSRPENYELRVVRLSGDITWLRPEDFSSSDSPEEAAETVFYGGSDVINFDKYTALVFGAAFDENGQSDIGVIVGNSMWDAQLFRLDMSGGELTATQAGLGVDVDSPTAAKSDDGLIVLDYADSATADEYTSVQTVDAANGAGTEQFVLCARHDFSNFYIVGLDYSAGAMWPVEGENIAGIGELLAGQCVTIEAESSGGFGIVYTDQESRIRRYYVSVDGTGAIEFCELARSSQLAEIAAGALYARQYPVSAVSELEEMPDVTVISSAREESSCCALLTTPLDELTVSVSYARSRADGATTYGGEGGGRYVLTPDSALAIYVQENSVNVTLSIDVDGRTETYGLYTGEDGALRVSTLTEPGDTGHGIAVTQVADPAAYVGGYDAVNEYGDARNVLITALDFYGEVSDLEVFRTLLDESTFAFSRGETVYTNAAPDRPLLIWNPVVGGIRTCEYGFSFTDAEGNQREYLIDFAAATMLVSGMVNVYPIE